MEEYHEEFPTSDWLTLLVHSYQAIEKSSKRHLWKIKHTEIVDLREPEGFNNSWILTRGSFLYVVTKDEQEKKQIWQDDFGSQIYRVLVYNKEKRGFMEIEANKGLSAENDKVMIVKDKGILYAVPIMRELMI